MQLDEDLESRLQIVFDKVILKSGQEIPFQWPAEGQAVARTKGCCLIPTKRTTAPGVPG
jgi:hypothetical protein